MKKAYLMLLLLLLPLTAARVEVEYSSDNSSWKQVTNLNTSDNNAYQINLQAGSTYYVRARDGSDWAYFIQRTKQGVEDTMTFIVVGLVFIFITALVVIGLLRAQKIWMKVILSLGLTFMLMTLLRLSSWFVSITFPTETNLIHALDIYYSFGVRAFYFLLAGGMIFLVIYILNTLKFRKKRKQQESWENWGDED